MANNRFAVTSRESEKYGKIVREECVSCRGDLSFFGRRLAYDYSVCSACATIQISPIPSKDQVEQAYQFSKYATAAHGQADPDEVSKSSRPYYVHLADTLSTHLANCSVIDYGAGWGGLCEVLLERGFDCTGIELAQNMVDECARRGTPVYQKTLDSLRVEKIRVGAFVLCGVFEHLLEPREFLNGVHELLEDGGILVSMQPTAPFARMLAWVCRFGRISRPLPPQLWIFDAPWHVALYSLGGMKLLAEQCGFELIEIRSAPQGRVKGAYGIAQSLLEYINRIGWSLLKTRWPLVLSHTFVFRKKSLK